MPQLERTPMTMLQKLTLSWSMQVRNGKKSTYEGTVPKAVAEKRHRQSKAAKQARKRNRGANRG